MKIPHDKFFVLVYYDMLLENMELIAKNRINCSIYYSAHKVLDGKKENELCKIRSFLEKNSLSAVIHGPFIDLNPGSLDRKIREVALERFDETLTLTKFLGANHITFHSGYRPKPYRKYKDEWLKNSIEIWKKLILRAEKEKIMMTVENAFEKTPELLIKLVERIDSPNFSICFDGGHFNAFSDTPPLEAFDMLPAKRIGEIHLSDNDGTDDQHVPLGEGNINLDGLFKRIETLDINPVIVLEPNDVEGAIKSLEYLKAKGLID